MPKVEQFGASKVSTQVTQGARASGLPAAAFSTGLEGLASVGQGLQQLGQRMNTTAAEEALVGFERAKNDLFFNPKNGYFNTQGRDSFDAAEGANSSLEKLQQQFSDTLSSPGAKSLFSKAAGVHVTRGGADIMRHSTKGLQAWEVATIRAQSENSLESAALYWNDTKRLAVNNAVGRQSVIDAADLEGIDGIALNERLQTYDSVFATNAITAATASSATEGQALMESTGDMLEGPARVRLDKSITAKQVAEKTQQDAQMSVTTATRLNADHDNRSDIIEQVNKIDDPELRRKTMAESMRQFGQQKQADSEARAASFEDAEGHVVDGGSAATYQAQDPEGWARLSPKQQSKIAAGEAIVTDWNKFSELMVMPKSQLAKVDPTDHFSELAPAERSKLIGAVKTANGVSSSTQKTDHQVGRTRSAETSAAVEQIFGKKSKWNDAKREQANGFYALVDSEVAFREDLKGSRLTSEEYTDVLGGLTRKTVKEGFFFDSELDITEVPAEDVPTLSKFLRDNGVPVTSDNLIKAFEQASQ